MALRRQLLTYLPPVALLIGAATIPAGMLTGYPNYEFWQSLRAGLIGTAFCYLPAAFFVRVLLRGLREKAETDAAACVAGKRCERCGYDLRVTPARCPECGTVPSRAA